MKRLLIAAIVAAIRPLAAQDSVAVSHPVALHGYGTLNYYAFDWQSLPHRRNALDVERLALYPSLQYSPSLSVHAEIEFEHGGTGATMEFDPVEEFGEYETEVEKGGEVALEQLHLLFNLQPYFHIRAGAFKLPIGLNSQEDEPSEYFTTTRSEMESSIIPTNWYEMGVEVFGTWRKWTYHLALTNGLDPTGFSSGSWIVLGNQKRFETINAQNLALCSRLDYAWADDQLVGVAAYYGNTTGNRPKPDMTADAHVAVVEGHALYAAGPWTLRGIGIYGRLQNADLVSLANRNLSNNLNVKRTPVGSAALGVSGEAAFNALSFWRSPHRLDLFGRYEYYDTMFRTAGDVFNNPRWERHVVTAGANYHVRDEVVLKAQYSARKLGAATANHENTFSMSLGFEF